MKKPLRNLSWLALAGLLLMAAVWQPGVLLIPPGAAGAPGLAFQNDADTGLWSSGANTLNFSTGGSERARIDSAGHLESLGTAPSLGACGTSPSIVGTDVAGKVTVGGAGAGLTSCALTFAGLWTNAPACTGVNETQILFTKSVSTTTGLTFDTAATMATGNVIAYQCIGRR